MSRDDQTISGGIVAALRACVEAGESRGALAERVGMTRANLSNLINGRKATITLETADRIAAELGLRLVR